jgi:hypothetical protein
VGTDRSGHRDLLAAGGVLRGVNLQEPVLRIWTYVNIQMKIDINLKYKKYTAIST